MSSLKEESKIKQKEGKKLDEDSTHEKDDSSDSEYGDLICAPLHLKGNADKTDSSRKSLDADGDGGGKTIQEILDEERRKKKEDSQALLAKINDEYLSDLSKGQDVDQYKSNAQLKYDEQRKKTVCCLKVFS